MYKSKSPPDNESGLCYNLYLESTKRSIRIEEKNITDSPGHCRCAGAVPGQQPGRPLRRTDHAAGAAQGPPEQRPHRHAGLWNAGAGDN